MYLYAMNSNKFIKYKNKASIVIKTYHINIKKIRSINKNSNILITNIKHVDGSIENYILIHYTYLFYEY